MVLQEVLHNTAPLNGLLSLKRAYSSDLLLWFAGHAIKCYQCTSIKSWDDCVPGNDTPCPLPTPDSCLKVKIVLENEEGKNVSVFVKSCAKKKNCNKDFCKSVAQELSMKFKDCDVNCCDTDLCNGANVTMVQPPSQGKALGTRLTMVSSFLFLACVLVANFR